MKKSHFYYVVSMIALAFALLGSCQKDERTLLFEEQQRYNFTLTEAKEFFYLEATDLQLPSQTIGKVKSGLPDLKDITTIDWKNADVKDYVNYLSYEVPLHNSRHTHAVMLQKIGVDSVLCENADVRYSLLLQRAKSKDTTRMLVSTIISLAKDRKRVEKLQSDRFHGNRRGFTGYVIVSTLEGAVESIYSYDKGRREYYSKYTISTNVDSMRNNSGGFSFVVMGGGGETPETPEPPNDPKDTLIVSDILSMVGYDLQSAKDMIDRIVEIVVQRKPDVYGSFILDRSTILHQIANFKSLINQ